MTIRDPRDEARRSPARATAAAPGRPRPSGVGPVIEIDAHAIVVVGALRVDGPAQRATLRERPLELTRMELRLLTAFAQHAGRVLRNAQIALAVWGPMPAITCAASAATSRACGPCSRTIPRARAGS